MERKEYVKIRSSLDLNRKKFALPAHLACDALLIGGIAALWGAGLKACVFPLVTTVIFRSFSLMHDAVHGAVSRNKFLNDVVGIFFGGISFLPFEQWKENHLEHHYWSGNLERDPVMGFLVVYPRMPAWLRATLDFCWQRWIPSLGIVQHLVFWILSLRQGVVSAHPLRRVFSLLSSVTFWGSVLALSPSGFWLWAVAPAVLCYLIGVEIVNLPHHLQLNKVVGPTHFMAWNQYETARTCLYPEWFARFVVLNFNYHAEHHMFPDAPWYRLGEIHAAVRPALGHDLKTDPYFQWNRVNRKRKLADVLYRESDDVKAAA